MLKLLPRILPIIIFGGIFIFVLLKVDYPKSLTSATFFQLGEFLIPLFLTLTFAFNLVISYLIISTTLSFGLIILLILKGLDELNIATAALSLVAIYLLVSYFHKNRKSKLKSQPSKITNLPAKKKPSLTKPL